MYSVSAQLSPTLQWDNMCSTNRRTGAGDISRCKSGRKVMVVVVVVMVVELFVCVMVGGL